MTRVSDTTYQLLARMERTLLALEPRIAFIQTGDGEQGTVPMARSVSNFAAILDSCDAHGIFPVLYAATKDSHFGAARQRGIDSLNTRVELMINQRTIIPLWIYSQSVSYTHLRAHETGRNL